METKQELRRSYKASGANLTKEYRDFADCAIRAFVQYSEVWQRAENIFIYVSMWAEPDTRALIEAGLEGMECYYPLHDEAMTERFLGMAKQRGLIITKGSDYHGDW